MNRQLGIIESYLSKCSNFIEEIREINEKIGDIGVTDNELYEIELAVLLLRNRVKDLNDAEMAKNLLVDIRHFSVLVRECHTFARHIYKNNRFN